MTVLVRLLPFFLMPSQAPVCVVAFAVFSVSVCTMLVPILRPAWLRDSGYYLQGCRSYVEGGIRYNYKLYNEQGEECRCTMTGSRGMLSYLFPKHLSGQNRRKREYLHRLWALNHPVINAAGLPYAPRNEVHHRPHPRWKPWSNSTTSNMQLMRHSDHEEWHRQHPDVPRCR